VLKVVFLLQSWIKYYSYYNIYQISNNIFLVKINIEVRHDS